MGKSDATNRAADIIVVDEKDRVLMQLRDKEGEHSHRGCWALPGGAVEEGESPEEAIQREYKEETGCTCKPELALVEKYKTEDGRIIDKYVYKHNYDGCNVQVFEGQKFEFKTLDEIEDIKNKNPHSEEILKKVLEK